VAEHPSLVHLAELTRRWLADVQVLADPTQLDGGRVWTRAQDVLPGVVVVPGVPLTAAWGEQTWQGVPEWDPNDVDGLWLTPVTEPHGPPDGYAGCAAGRLVQSLRLRIGQANGTAPTSEVDELSRTVSDLLEPALDDLIATVALLVEAVQRDRRTAQDAVSALADLPAKERRRILESQEGTALLTLARRSRPARRLRAGTTRNR
jgi:hypothetical protein